MQIDGFNKLTRGGADRTEETKRPERTAPTSTSQVSDVTPVDSLETDVSAFIGRSVQTAGRVLDTRLEALRSQKDEILRRADDPRSIRKAAETFVATAINE